MTFYRYRNESPPPDGDLTSHPDEPFKYIGPEVYFKNMEFYLEEDELHPSLWTTPPNSDDESSKEIKIPGLSPAKNQVKDSLGMEIRIPGLMYTSSENSKEDGIDGKIFSENLEKENSQEICIPGLTYTERETNSVGIPGFTYTNSEKSNEDGIDGKIFSAKSQEKRKLPNTCKDSAEKRHKELPSSSRRKGTRKHRARCHHKRKEEKRSSRYSDGYVSEDRQSSPERNEHRSLSEHEHINSHVRNKEKKTNEESEMLNEKILLEGISEMRKLCVRDSEPEKLAGRSEKTVPQNAPGSIVSFTLKKPVLLKERHGIFKSAINDVLKDIPVSDSKRTNVSNREEIATSKQYDAITIKKEKNTDDEEEDFKASLEKYKESQKARKDKKKLTEYSDSSEYDSDKSVSKRSIKKEIKTEQEYFREDEWFGIENYYCKVCQLTLNSEATYDSHIKGKRHKKALKSQNITEIAKAGLRSVMQCQEASQQLKTIGPRKITEQLPIAAEIQEEADRHYDNPVPGLQHITENRTYPKDITYYCEICDAKCTPPSILPHLVGFKHYLYCLKEIDRDFYEYNKDRPKKEIIGKVRHILFKHERKYGRGKIKVIREIPLVEQAPYNEPGPSWRNPAFPMHEMKNEFRNESEDNEGVSKPPDFDQYLDTSKNDFHCTLCDVHMNNIQMWESHIIGKKHAKTLKKQPGANSKTWSKPQTLKAPPNMFSTLEAKLKAHEDEVIVGLDFIRETKAENGVLYNCFLCGGGCTNSDILEHLCGLKHRIKYLEKTNSTGQFPNAISLVSNLDVNTATRESLVLSECARIEKEYGRGKVEIYLSKR